jgi:hypothetical protein
MRGRRFVRIAVLFALTFGSWIASGPALARIPDAAGGIEVAFESQRLTDGTGSVEIHKRVCPNGAPQADIFAECHDTPPGQPVAFTVDGGAPVEANEAGDLEFPALEPGTHTFTEREGPPLAYVNLRVFCTDLGRGGEV